MSELCGLSSLWIFYEDLVFYTPTLDREVILNHNEQETRFHAPGFGMAAKLDNRIPLSIARGDDKVKIKDFVRVTFKNIVDA